MMWQGLRDSYCEDDAIVTEIRTGFAYSFVILNLVQDNKPPSHVILKRVQDDELWDDANVTLPHITASQFAQPKIQRGKPKALGEVIC